MPSRFKEMGAISLLWKKSIKALKQGGILGIFPEGRMKKEEDSTSAKAGAAYLAIKTNVPIVPIAILGSGKALPVRKNGLNLVKLGYE